MSKPVSYHLQKACENCTFVYCHSEWEFSNFYCTKITPKPRLWHEYNDLERDNMPENEIVELITDGAEWEMENSVSPRGICKDYDRRRIE